MIRFMKRVGRISRNLAQAWITGVWFFLVAYFAVHAFQGDSSLSALKALEQQQQVLLADAQATRELRISLEQRVLKLSGAELDPDMLEEQVRKQLGFTHPDEIILFLN